VRGDARVIIDLVILGTGGTGDAGECTCNQRFSVLRAGGTGIGARR
jgi:hypothetical protein